MIKGIVKLKWNHGSFIFKIEGPVILLYGSVMPEGTTSGRKDDAKNKIENSLHVVRELDERK